MDAPELGHAVIVNNVAEEFAGSFRDVEKMTLALERMGLDVDTNTNCNKKVSQENRDLGLSFATNCAKYIVFSAMNIRLFMETTFSPPKLKLVE